MFSLCLRTAMLWHTGVKLRGLVPLWLNFHALFFATKTLRHKESTKCVTSVFKKEISTNQL